MNFHENALNSLQTTRPSVSGSVLRLIAVVSFLAVLNACGRATANIDLLEQTTARQQDPNSIALNDGLRSHLKIGPIPIGDSSETIRLAGRIEKNGNQVGRTGSPVAGRVVTINASLGMDMKEGDVMAEIASQELAAAQLAYLTAHSTEQLAQRSLDRVRQLLEAGVVGAAELQRRESELAVARAQKRASADQLRTLGISAASLRKIAATGHILPSLPIHAKLSGTVVERNITQGQVVQPSDSLFVITDLAKLWAVADVPEQQAAQVRVGQSVEIEVPALGTETIAGPIVFIDNLVNPETRTVRVRVEVDNAERRLKPAMLMTMRVDARKANQALIPSTAVVRNDDKDYVFLIEPNNVATLVPVKLAAQQGEYRALLEPLNLAGAIVLDGAFHLNNERQRQQVQQGKS
jgi:membrane fusion protein, heavy metal efflux system